MFKEVYRRITDALFGPEESIEHITELHNPNSGAYYVNTFPRDNTDFNVRTFDVVGGLEEKVSELRTVDESKRGFLLIDMQEPFLRELHDDERVDLVTAQKQVLRYCARHDIPVIALEYRGNGKTIKVLRSLVDKVPRHTYLQKPWDNGFSANEGLAIKLREWNIEEVYLMGVNASACVLDTGMGAIKDGFRIVSAYRLIADSRKRIRNREKKNKSRDWYIKNGVFLE